MKLASLLLAPLALAVLTSPAQDEPVYAPEEDTVLVRTFEARIEGELADLEVAWDGEDQDLANLELDYSFDSLETIVVTDEILEVGDGRPTELLRTFDELSQEETISTRGEEFESVLQSDLEGRTLRFEWDEDAEYYTVEAADDEDEPSDEVLEWLEEDMDLRAVLPEDEVEVGDSWEIDEWFYLTLMWPGGLLGFYKEEEGAASEFSRSLNQQTIENLEGEGEAYFEEIREEDGVRVAVLRIELEITTRAKGTDDSGATDVEIERDIQREMEGYVLWDLDHGHLFSAELEATSESTLVRTFEADTLEGAFEVENTEFYSGTITYTVTIERE